MGQMGRRKWTLLCILVMTVALIVAACGGGGEPTATPRPTPTPSAAPTPTAAPTATLAPSPTATPAPPSLGAPVGLLAGKEPKYGGTLQARLFVDWAIWDTYHVQGGFTQVFVQQLLSNLVHFRKDWVIGREVVPDTALSWDVGGDGRTYTFRLRKDVVWSDGKPFTSADVAYNLQRATDPKLTFNSQRVKAIARVETPDPSTVTVRLKDISTSFLLNIATPFMLMYPAHVPDLTAWQKSPVGTGPFLFQEYNKNVSYVFKRNPGYYQKDAAGRSLPYLEMVIWHIIPDPALALSAFRTGRIQCGCQYDIDFLTQAKESLTKEIPGVNLSRTLGGTLELQFNVRRPPFSNAAFRQALAIGLDKEQLAAVHMGGSNWSPASPLWPPEWGGRWGLPKEELYKLAGYARDHTADLALAQQKLKESGVDPKGLEIELITPAIFQADAEAVAAVLGTQLGIKIKVSVPSRADFAKRRIEGSFDVAIRTIGPAMDDPAEQYAAALLSDGADNYGGYANARIDQLLQNQDREVDAVKRQAMLWEVQRTELTELPIVMMFWEGSVYGTRPEVRNYNSNRTAVSASERLDEVWLEQ